MAPTAAKVWSRLLSFCGPLSGRHSAENLARSAPGIWTQCGGGLARNARNSSRSSVESEDKARCFS